MERRDRDCRGNFPIPRRAGGDSFSNRRLCRGIEVYVECPLEVLVDRDVKGLYRKALAGEIPQFTGISDPYEAPLNPEVVVNSSTETPEQSVDRIWAKLEDLGIIFFNELATADQRL